MTTYTILVIGLLTIMVVFPINQDTEYDLSHRPYIIVWLTIGITATLILLSLCLHGEINV
jgi:hypothetical protein